MESLGISDQQLAQAAEAGGASSSHAMAAEAAEMEASVERFLDEAMIEEFKATPLHTLEGVLEERKELGGHGLRHLGKEKRAGEKRDC